ncbi:L-histidine N(alpha)-methyltransferase [Streptomyces sp. NPDC058534]|uniref:L-histidine N(alpha)-methyltransferase n=1 Tax=Streptomyces sp. NPDC058534 TaxID=3346541 RepID=UPI003647B3B2
MLTAAYDDGADTTAEFNKNVLSALNRRLGAGLNPPAFDHVALREADNKWIEMRPFLPAAQAGTAVFVMRS